MHVGHSHYFAGDQVEGLVLTCHLHLHIDYVLIQRYL